MDTTWIQLGYSLFPNVFCKTVATVLQNLEILGNKYPRRYQVSRIPEQILDNCYHRILQMPGVRKLSPARESAQGHGDPLGRHIRTAIGAYSLLIRRTVVGPKIDTVSIFLIFYQYF